MIIVTEEAKALLGTFEHPEGTVLRLDPVAHDQATQQITLGFGAGEPQSDDQIVEQEGEEVLRIAAPVSGLLNGSTMDVMVQEEDSENGAERPSVVHRHKAARARPRAVGRRLVGARNTT